MDNSLFQKPKTQCKNAYETNTISALFEPQRNPCEIPYKTNGKSILLDADVGKCHQNYQKALPREGFRDAFPKRRKTL